jgi:hypothetical protein
MIYHKHHTNIKKTFLRFLSKVCNVPKHEQLFYLTEIWVMNLSLNCFSKHALLWKHLYLSCLKTKICEKSIFIDEFLNYEIDKVSWFKKNYSMEIKLNKCVYLEKRT